MSRRAKLVLAWLVVAAIALLFAGILTTSIQGQSCTIPPNIQVSAGDFSEAALCATYLKFEAAFSDAKARRWWERSSTGNEYIDFTLEGAGPLLLIEAESLPYRGSFSPFGPTIEIRSNAWTEGAGIHEAQHFIWWKQGGPWQNVGHGTQDDPLFPLLVRERGWLYPYVVGHPYTPVITTSDGIRVTASGRCTF